MSRKKIKYKTVSLPSRLADDIQELMDEFGYWPSLGAFVREAALDKLRRERLSPGKFVPEPIVFLDDEATKRSYRKNVVHAEIDKLVLEAEEDPNISEEEKEAIRDFASKVSKKLIELENIFKNGDEG